ncbi:MAG: hypothetical protein KDD51_16930, partial [Bdellovibrionales bacterium]|nr:hypothetical protein [Bdellovibrionales bacterium]
YPPQTLASWVSFTWDKDSDIYYVRCVAQNPDAAHDLCQVYLSTVQEVYPEIGQRGVQAKLEFLRRQISTLSKQTVDREHSISDFEKQNREFMGFLTAIIENKSLQHLRNKLLEIEQKIRINRSMKALLSKERDPGAPTPASYEETQKALSRRLSELMYKQHLTRYSTDTQDKDDRLQGISKEIELVNTQIKQIKEAQQLSLEKHPFSEQERRTMVADLQMQHQINLVKLSNLKKEINAIEEQKSKFREKELEYSRLKSELTHKTTLLASLYRKEQDTEIELSAVRSEIFRLNQPTRSGHRIEPQLSKHVFAGTSVSIFAIVLTSILLLTFFPRLDNESDANRLGLPILGKIPVFKEWFGNVNTLNPFALEYLKIMSYRILRETKGSKCPVAIVTSPHPGEGKSTVTYFLSLASKSPGRKCLFIDGDLLTAHPNSFFGIPEDHTPGLKAIVDSGDKQVNLSELIVETRHEGIHFLPRGGRSQSVSSPNFLKPVIRELDNLRQQYDLIFIDTPPLFASSLAHQWAGIGDLIVLVARMYLTRPRDIVEALQTCKIFSKAPVGIALNCLPLHRQRGRGSYYYYFSRRRPTKAAA